MKKYCKCNISLKKVLQYCKSCNKQYFANTLIIAVFREKLLLHKFPVRQTVSSKFCHKKNLPKWRHTKKGYHIFCIILHILKQANYKKSSLQDYRFCCIQPCISSSSIDALQLSQPLFGRASSMNKGYLILRMVNFRGEVSFFPSAASPITLFRPTFPLFPFLLHFVF